MHADRCIADRLDSLLRADDCFLIQPDRRDFHHFNLFVCEDHLARSVWTFLTVLILEDSGTYWSFERYKGPTHAAIFRLSGHFCCIKLGPDF